MVLASALTSTVGELCPQECCLNLIVVQRHFALVPEPREVEDMVEEGVLPVASFST